MSNSTSSAKHTPGQWEVDSEGGVFMVCSGADTVICRGIKNEADAHLLCASQDLLRELQGALQALESHGFTQQAGTASAAIAKAQGGAS